MPPPDINSLPSSTTPPSTSNQNTAPTTPRQHPRTPTNTATTSGTATAQDPGIIPFPRSMSFASQSQENNGSPGNASPGFIGSGSGFPLAGSGFGSPGSSLRGNSQSPRLSITGSLQAAAAVNAGLRSEEDSRRSSVGSITRQRSTRSPHTTARRRSTVLMTLQLNDPALPAPGEMVNEPHPNLTAYASGLGRASPRSLGSPIIPTREASHNRAPSLGEIHQELEQEQEAQVNRLLQMIRVQQAQLQALQSSHPSTSTSTSAIDDHTATTSTSTTALPPSPHIAHAATQPLPLLIPGTGTPTRTPLHARTSFDARSARPGSRTPSRNASPGLPLRTPSIGPPLTQYPSGMPPGRQASEEWLSGVSTRDEAQFYQAEAQMMTRENQMLRVRIRELEREVRDRGEGGGGGGSGRRGSVSYEPVTPSGLVRGLSVRGGRGTGDRVSEMGGEEDGEASPRSTPGLKGEAGGGGGDAGVAGEKE